MLLTPYDAGQLPHKETENYGVPNSNSVESEKPCCRTVGTALTVFTMGMNYYF